MKGKSIYLIYHAETEDDGKTLSKLGKLQSYVTARYLKIMRTEQVFWEGEAACAMAETMGAFLNLQPYRADSRETGGLWLKNQADQVSGAVAVIAGKERILSVLGEITGLDYVKKGHVLQNCGAMNILQYEDGRFTVKSIGEEPNVALRTEDCLAILQLCGISEEQIAHSKAAAEYAQELGKEMAEHGAALNTSLIYSASLLCGLTDGTAKKTNEAAYMLDRLGNRTIAEIIACSDSLPEDCMYLFSEKTVVFYAAHLVDGQAVLTPAEYRDRFGSDRAGQKTADQLEFIGELIESLLKNNHLQVPEP